jgi:hypothetical protein
VCGGQCVCGADLVGDLTGDRASGLDAGFAVCLIGFVL